MLLAHTIGEKPNTEDLLMLVECEIKTRRHFLNRRSIEISVTDQIPFKDVQGCYDIVPVPAMELRQNLLALTRDNGDDDPASRCLNAIDEFRDEYGAPENEPRHPDLRSGRPWPILAPEPVANDGH